MKLLLANGADYSLISGPNKVNKMVNNIYTDCVVYVVSGELEQIKNDFNNQDALSLVSVFDDNGKQYGKYSGYQKLVSISVPVDNTLGDNVFEVTVALTNDVQELIRSWNGAMESNEEVINGIVKDSDEVKTIAKEMQETVKSIIGNDDIDTMTLEEAIAYRIKESKLKLQEYLEDATIMSSCHGGRNAEYSVTSEKQQYLISMISIAELAIANGVDYQPSWNARGEICSYDWTVDELKQLAFEMETFVRPLVSKQQSIESTIRKCESVEEVKAVKILYK